jgi:hypothetical protein
VRYEDVECAEAPFDDDDDGAVVFKYSPPTTRGVARGFEVVDDAMMMRMGTDFSLQQISGCEK